MIDGVCSRHMNTAENRNRLRHGFLHAAGYRDNTVAIVNIKVIHWPSKSDPLALA